MTEDINNELVFQEELIYIVERFGTGNQEGAKEALRFSQDSFDYVSKSHQKQISEAFQLDEKIIKTLIKFTPSIKESIVEYEVVCCTGARCAKNGSIDVIKAVKNVLGVDFNKTTSDGRIKLTTQNCFKKCGIGPNIMINGKFYNHMTKDKVKEVLEEIL